MANDLRNDVYCLSYMRQGVPAYGTVYGSPIVRDTYYPIGPVYKESIIYGIQLTTSADLTGATAKFVIRRNGVVAITTAYADQTIATAQSDKELTVGTMFTVNFKPNRFTFGDIVANTPAIAAVIPDFNCLDVAFQITGADVPSSLNVLFRYFVSGQA